MEEVVNENEDARPNEELTNNRTTTPSDNEQTILGDYNSDEYDTDIDDEDYMEVREEFKRSQSRQNLDNGHITYRRVCAKYGITPLTRIIDQLHKTELNLNHACLSDEHFQALSRALEDNSRVEILNLEGNDLREGIQHILGALLNNVYVTKLHLANTRLGPKRMSLFSELLQKNPWIVEIDLSGNHIGDEGITELCCGLRVSTVLQENKTLNNLNISGNNIAFVGSKKLRDCLASNRHLEKLDLSWNALSGPAAVAVCKALKVNKALKEVDLSWNGFGLAGGVGIEDTFKYNSCLRLIDLSNNRIDFKAIPHISRGLSTNQTLETLKLGQNPISTDGCFVLLKVISGRKCKLRYLGFEGIPINKRIAEEAEKLSMTRPFTLSHGGILRSDAKFGFKTVETKDPLSKLLSHLETNNIRVLDMFRMFGSESKHKVTNKEMIKGLEKINAPLDLSETRELIKRVNVSKDNCITYTELSMAIRKHVIREREREKAVREEESKMRAEKEKILQSDLPSEKGRPGDHKTNLYENRLIGRGAAKSQWARVRRSVTLKTYLSVAATHRKPLNRFTSSSSLMCLTRPSSRSSIPSRETRTPVKSFSRLSVKGDT